jgi:hypothetical protein
MPAATNQIKRWHGAQRRKRLRPNVLPSVPGDVQRRNVRGQRGKLRRRGLSGNGRRK